MNEHPKTYHFFVDAKRYETDKSFVRTSSNVEKERVSSVRCREACNVGPSEARRECVV